MSENAGDSINCVGFSVFPIDSAIFNIIHILYDVVLHVQNCVPYRIPSMAC